MWFDAAREDSRGWFDSGDSPSSDASAPVEPSSGTTPPFQVGQYATYFLDRLDGSWAAISLSIARRNKDGSWALAADFKNESVENFVSASIAADARMLPPLDIHVLGFTTVRGSSEGPFNSPISHFTLALNLFSPRNSQLAHDALKAPAVDVDLPCGLRVAYPIWSTHADYTMRYDLNLGVMLTGVARLSTDDGNIPMTITSFGTRNMEKPLTHFDDYVDLSHPKLTSTKDSSSAIRRRGSCGRKPLKAVQMSCAGVLRSEVTRAPGTCRSRYTRAGTNESPKSARSIVKRLSGPGENGGLRLVPREADSRSGGDDSVHVMVLDYPGIAGMLHCRLVTSPNGGLACVRAFGCISKESPRRDQTLRDMERTFDEILASFRFC